MWDFIQQEADFDWTPPQKGIILSAYSWGYMFIPIGAIISNKLGGITSFALGIFVFGILTLLSPCVIQWNLIAFISLRFMEGFFQVNAHSKNLLQNGLIIQPILSLYFLKEKTKVLLSILLINIVYYSSRIEVPNFTLTNRVCQEYHLSLHLYSGFHQMKGCAWSISLF